MGFSNKPKYFPGDVTGEISMSIQDADDQIKTDQEKSKQAGRGIVGQVVLVIRTAERLCHV